MSKRAQIESGEMIMVVIIVMLFLIIGIAVYANLKGQGYEDRAEEIASLSAVDLAQEASGMQEIACGFSNEIGGKCLDVYRINALSAKIGVADTDTNNYYRSKFGTALITIEQVYPSVQNWTIYNITRQGGRSQIPLKMPLYIYDPITKTNSFGFMTVVRYS